MIALAQRPQAAIPVRFVVSVATDDRPWRVPRSRVQPGPTSTTMNYLHQLREHRAGLKKLLAKQELSEDAQRVLQELLQDLEEKIRKAEGPQF